ncbi:MAG: polysaccharide deacetylase family protein, partial [Salinibacterium sp.]|nr:polysaccharide deacetylase family protein [Salinibacterium sp.]
MSEDSIAHREPVVHALSFDIEDWFHIVEVKAVEDPAQWPKLSAESSLVERYTDLILKICDDAGVTATFYLLGWIAERHPAMCARIASAGHEIGTHSFWHRKVYELDAESFHKDMTDSLDAIEAATGVRARTFRAPSFSITDGT